MTAVLCAVVISVTVEEEVSSRGEGPLRGLTYQVVSDSTFHPDRSSDRSRYHTRVSSRHQCLPGAMCHPVPTDHHQTNCPAPVQHLRDSHYQAPVALLEERYVAPTVGLCCWPSCLYIWQPAQFEVLPTSSFSDQPVVEAGQNLFLKAGRLPVSMLHGNLS